MEKANIELQQGQTKEERPKILTLRNGPYYLLNDMEPKVVENLQNSKGKPLSTIRGVALCRCGASNNKPFCDGMHRTVNFKDDKN
jgi:CDGSH-type Zn-finger protein